MDKLDMMFKKQKELQERLGTFKKIKTVKDKQAFINQMGIAIVEEAIEILRATPYKNPSFVKFGWKKNQTMNKSLFKEEIVDLWHFLINMAMIAEMGPNEFFSIYCKKNKINFIRQKNKY